MSISLENGHFSAAPMCGSRRLREVARWVMQGSLPMQRLERWGSAGCVSSSCITRETCRQNCCWHVRGRMRGLAEITLQAPSPILRVHEVAAERRTTRASSAGAGTIMGSSGTATPQIAATTATVVPERDGPALATFGGFVAVGVVFGTGR